MTREAYIQYRISNQFIPIIYELYYEECLRKDKQPISIEIFNHVFPLYPLANKIVDESIIYYDKVFDIKYLEYKEKIIRIL